MNQALREKYRFSQPESAHSEPSALRLMNITHAVEWGNSHHRNKLAESTRPRQEWLAFDGTA